MMLGGSPDLPMDAGPARADGGLMPHTDGGAPPSDAGAQDAGAASPDAGAPDGGALVDAGVGADGGSKADGGSGSAAGLDAGLSSDAGVACRPERVRMPGGSTLAVGVLCDDVFACVAGEPQAAALVAVEPRFQCAAMAQGAGCAGWGCTWRAPGGPSVLDEGEFAGICKATLLEPAAALRCMVYLQ